MPEIEPPFTYPKDKAPGQLAQELAQGLVQWLRSVDGPDITVDTAAKVIDALLAWMRRR